jgi:hypothetical protein
MNTQFEEKTNNKAKVKKIKVYQKKPFKKKVIIKMATYSPSLICFLYKEKKKKRTKFFLN